MASQPAVRHRADDRYVLRAIGQAAAVAGVLVVVYVAVSAILAATTSIDLPLTHWPF
jgi:hypothetical protein